MADDRIADEAAVRFLSFAGAASRRRCGTLIAALQSMSPLRSLEASLTGEIQTVLSPQLGSTTEERDEVVFRCSCANGCFTKIVSFQ